MLVPSIIKATEPPKQGSVQQDDLSKYNFDDRYAHIQDLLINNRIPFNKKLFDIYPVLDYNKKDIEGCRGLIQCESNMDRYTLRFTLKNLSNGYKIHLMPKDNNFMAVTINLLKAMQKNHVLQQTISNIKIKPVFEVDINGTKDTLYGLTKDDLLDVPKIVIYIYGGKADAQRALNEIYTIFKNEEGVNRSPKYNEKVTSLIYFAQGNRDDKDIEKFRIFLSMRTKNDPRSR